MNILVVDDDRDLVDALSYILHREGYRVIPAYDGGMALKRFEAEVPSLVILDANMPELDGFEVCRRLRQVSNVPIIMLTARTDESDVVNALGLGADDYVTKPFSFRQLVARVKAVLRRTAVPSAAGSSIGGGRLVSGEFAFDPDLREVVAEGRPVRLTPLESRILHYLMINEGRVLTPQAIVERVWGYAGEGNQDLVKVHIRRLREKVEPDDANPRYIQTIPGLGYCFRSSR
jgi:DNA-binding response OmpR family regulator